jgi:hypothetical protein
MIAVWGVVTVPAVAVNSLLSDPALIVTLAGTLRAVRLLDRLTDTGLVASFDNTIAQSWL